MCFHVLKKMRLKQKVEGNRGEEKCLRNGEKGGEKAGTCRIEMKKKDGRRMLKS